MARKRSDADDQVAELLRTARESLGLSTAFLSRLDGRTQHLEVVESSVPLLFPEKARVPQATSLCQAALDGRVPSVMGDLTDFPEAMRLPSAWVPRIRSFVTVPVHLSDGTLYGTFCAAGLASDPDLTDRDRALMEVLARAAAVVVEPTVVEAARREAIEARLRPLMRAGGPVVLLQPIVDLATGSRVGAEALSRFPSQWGSPPDAVFADAHSVGLGDALEIQAVRRGLREATSVPGYVSVNLSPATLLTARARKALARVPGERLVVELSEHDPVDDYGALSDALAPLRAGGVRLAIDDVGAGFSSLRHIVVTSPDIIKLDRSLVSGVAGDPVLATLARSLVDVAAGLGATVVAEGVETVADSARLRDLGVALGQGWLFGRAVAAAELADSYPAAGERPAPVPAPRSGPAAGATAPTG